MADEKKSPIEKLTDTTEKLTDKAEKLTERVADEITDRLSGRDARGDRRSRVGEDTVPGAPAAERPTVEEPDTPRGPLPPEPDQ